MPNALSGKPPRSHEAPVAGSGVPVDARIATIMERADGELRRAREELCLRWSVRVQQLEESLRQETQRAERLETELARVSGQLAALAQDKDDACTLADAEEAGLHALLDGVFGEQQEAETRLLHATRQLTELQRVVDDLRDTARLHSAESLDALQERDTAIASLKKSLLAHHEAAQRAEAQAREELDAALHRLSALQTQRAREFAEWNAKAAQERAAHEQQLRDLSERSEAALAASRTEAAALAESLRLANAALRRADEAIQRGDEAVRRGDEALRQAQEVAARERLEAAARLQDQERRHDEAGRGWQERETRLRDDALRMLEREEHAHRIRIAAIEEQARQRLAQAEVAREHAAAGHEATVAALKAQLDQAQSQWTADRRRLQSALELARKQASAMQSVAQSQWDAAAVRIQTLEGEQAQERAHWAAAYERARQAVAHLSDELDNQLSALQEGPARLLRGAAIRAVRAAAHACRRALQSTQPAGLQGAPERASAGDLPSLLALDDPAFIDEAYRSLLHREPDSEGRHHYLERLASGTSRWRVLADLRRSSEGARLTPRVGGIDEALAAYARRGWPLVGAAHRRRLQALSAAPRFVVVPDVTQSAADGRVDGLQAMLQDLRDGASRMAEAVPVAVALDRVAGRLGLDAWSCARDLVHAEGADLVRLAHGMLKGQEPDAAELALWQGRLDAGASRTYLVSSLIDSLAPEDADVAAEQSTTLPGGVDVAQLRLVGPTSDVLAKARASGAQWLCFLESTTRLAPGSLEAMIAVFEAFPGTGLVGTAVVGPLGRLLHVGARLDDQGRVHWVGRGAWPGEDGLRHVRTVDLTGDAAFMLPRALFEATDPGWLQAPAGSVAAALALSLRDRGYRAVVVPAACARTATATQPQPDLGWLAKHMGGGRVVGEPTTAVPMLAIFDRPPDPESDSRGRSLFNMLLALRAAGADVEVIVESPAVPVAVATAMRYESRGLAFSTASGPGAIADALAGRPAAPAAVLLCGSECIVRHAGQVTTLFPAARRIGLLLQQPLPPESALQSLHMAITDSRGVLQALRAACASLPSRWLPPMLDTSRGPETLAQRSGVYVAPGTVEDPALQRIGRAPDHDSAVATLVLGDEPAEAAAAMAAGSPVMVTAALAEALGLRHQYEAIVVDRVADADGAARELSADPPRWQRLSDAAHRHALERYGPAPAARAVAEIMQEAQINLVASRFKARFYPTTNPSPPSTLLTQPGHGDRRSAHDEQDR